MSVFSSNNWPPSCSSASQSPINLTDADAKPCNLSCDLVMDVGDITQATATISNEGLVLESPMGLGSCKFRGESYVCQGLVVNHPSHHTINGVQADGEITGIFRKPTGELMCVSTLFRINSAQTPSYGFFKQFVPYAVPTGETKMQLRDWSIAHIVPPEASYYVYQGSTLVPPCAPCEWIVFKSMINMDQGDFAYLVRNVEAGSRPVQGIGNREVFFNDINNIPGGPMPHDNKFYLRLKPTKGSGFKKEKPTRVNLKDEQKPPEDSKEDPVTTVGQIRKWADGVGVVNLVISIFAVLIVGAGIYYGRSFGTDQPMKPRFANDYAVKTREIAAWAWSKIYALIVYFWYSIYDLMKLLYAVTIGQFVNIAKVETRSETAAADLADAADSGAKLLKKQADAAISGLGGEPTY